MSYLTKAFEHSEQANIGEAQYLKAQHTKQVTFYRKLSIGLGVALLSVCAGGGGYFIGQLSNENLQQSTEKHETIASSDTPEIKTNTVQPVHSNMSTQANPQVFSTQVQNMPGAPVNTNAQQPTVNYQWVSVQTGYDLQGNPTYEPQLVPVTALNQTPTISPVTQVAQGRVMQPSGPQLSGLQSSQVTAATQDEKLQTQQESALAQELEQVPEALKQAFAQAIEDTEQEDEREETIISTKDSVNATPIALLPDRIKDSIPSFLYQTHIYATDSEKRWIKINNRTLYEGDNIGALKLLEISPEQSRFDFDGIEFTIEALTDWVQ